MMNHQHLANLLNPRSFCFDVGWRTSQSVLDETLQFGDIFLRQRGRKHPFEKPFERLDSTRIGVMTKLPFGRSLFLIACSYSAFHAVMSNTLPAGSASYIDVG